MLVTFMQTRFGWLLLAYEHPPQCPDRRWLQQRLHQLDQRDPPALPLPQQPDERLRHDYATRNEFYVPIQLIYGYVETDDDNDD